MRSFALLVIAIFLVFGTSRPVAAAHESRVPRSRKVRLTVEFLPCLDEKGQPTMIHGEPVVNYIPDGAVVDKNDNVEIRTDVVVQSHPPTPYHSFGRLISLHDDAQIITSDRIFTDARGAFHATLRSRNSKTPWELDISRSHAGRGTKKG